MAAVAKKIGVEIETDVAVTKIIVEKGRARGVQLEDKGYVKADVVVSNADLPYTYTDLLPKRPARLSEAHWRKEAFTCSAFNLYLGTDRLYPELLHHNFFLTKNYRDNFEAIFERKEIPSEPSYYINRVTHTDPSLAPPGHDNLFVLVPIPHMTKKLTWDDAQTEAFKDRVYEQLERGGLTDLRKHVVVEHVYTPRDWNARYNLKYGAAFGLSHGLFQVGYFRPANKAPHIDGLYFVGASTVPGTGVPLVCIGAQLVTEQILQFEGGH
jgi:phytoene desaturase